MKKATYNRLLMQRPGYIQVLYLPWETVRRIHRTKRQDIQRAIQRSQRYAQRQRDRKRKYNTGIEERKSGPFGEPDYIADGHAIEVKTKERPSITKSVQEAPKREGYLSRLLKSLRIRRQG